MRNTHNLSWNWRGVVASGRLLAVAGCTLLASTDAGATFSANSGTMIHRFLPLQAGAVFTYAGYGQAAGLSVTYRVQGLETVDGTQTMKVQASGGVSWTAWLAQATDGSIWQLRAQDADGIEEMDFIFLPGALTAGQQFTYEGRWQEVLSVSATATTTAGTFTGCVRIREMYEYDDPREDVHYAPGIGVVRIAYPDAANSGFQLTSITGHTVPPAARFQLSGEVRMDGASGTGLAEVGIGLSPSVGVWDATTSNAGAYAYANLPSGTYSVVPSRAGYTFDPASRIVELDADTDNVSFVARVAGAPGFVDHPADQTAVTGQTVEFAARATADPEPSLQWQKRAAGGNEWANLSNTDSYAGVSTISLMVGPVSIDMSGDQFRCQATNSKGAAVSAEATLTVGPLLHVAAVAAGDDHSLFLATNGTLWAMGDNFGGQLGDGTTMNRGKPVRIMSGVSTFGAGTQCSLFTTTGGALWWRGSGWRGLTSPWSSPLASDVDHVAPGAQHCLFITSDRTLWAIGDHYFLPEGTYTYDPAVSVAVAHDVVAASAAGGYGDHSLFVTADGALWAWGDNGSGQLGDGTTTWRSFPVAVASGVARAAAGGDHSLFIGTDGSLWAMGFNAYGQLGDGTTTDRTTPVLIASQVAAVAASGFHSLFVTTDGTLWAMGNNEYGQLGDGATVDRNSPVAIATDVVSIAAGSYHSLFVKGDSTLWAMGWNGSGRLGDGTLLDQHTPVQVFVAETAAPIITTHPSARSVTAGDILSLSVAVDGTGPFAYQWLLNGAEIHGATGATCTLPSVQDFHAGGYTVQVTNAFGSTVSAPAMVTVDFPEWSDARLLNLSTRALALTGDDVMIPGFVITGTGSKKLLIRAVGPRLQDFGITDALADPQLVLRRNLAGGGSEVVAMNDDWGVQAGGGGVDAITDAAAQFGAFDLITDTKSAAILVELSAGSYGVVSSGVGGLTGVVVAEVYADPAEAETGGAQLANLSNRGFAGTGANIMIPGFVVSNEGPKTVLLRAIGPTLGTFGVAGALADPRLIVFQGNTELFSNDDWHANPDWMRTEQAASQVGAFALPAASKDAALVVTLNPGAYTVHGGAADGIDTGTILVEVYLAP